MDLSIIIVNWNTRELLRNCLRSLESGTDGVALQTIVVDNHSSDGSREMVKDGFPGVTLMDSGANVGFARGCNLGLGRAVAPLILFLNPDTEIRGAALRQMVDFMKANASVGALGCKIRNIGGDVKQLGLQWFPSPATELFKALAVSHGTLQKLAWILPYHHPETSGYVSKLFGACLLVRASVLKQVGSFDERFFMYCEDVDLCHRITNAGWRLFYLTDAEILHLGGGASSKAPSAFPVLMMCESMSKLMRKYYGGAGSASYRLCLLTGAQVRLGLLGAMRLAAALGFGGDPRRIVSSMSKYLTITQWTLGRRKPVIAG